MRYRVGFFLWFTIYLKGNYKQTKREKKIQLNSRIFAKKVILVMQKLTKVFQHYN